MLYQETNDVQSELEVPSPSRGHMQCGSKAGLLQRAETYQIKNVEVEARAGVQNGRMDGGGSLAFGVGANFCRAFLA
jgi:hypothetical protein